LKIDNPIELAYLSDLCQFTHGINRHVIADMPLLEWLRMKKEDQTYILNEHEDAIAGKEGIELTEVGRSYFQARENLIEEILSYLTSSPEEESDE
jgi:hypothetical protein